jgi:hypothetical protein
MVSGVCRGPIPRLVRLRIGVRVQDKVSAWVVLASPLREAPFRVRGDGRGVCGLTPSVRWTSPPNTTMKSWDTNLLFGSSNLGETRRGAFLLRPEIFIPFWGYR